MDADGTVHYLYPDRARVDATGNASQLSLRRRRGARGGRARTRSRREHHDHGRHGDRPNHQMDALDDAPVLSTLDTTQTTVAPRGGRAHGHPELHAGADAEGASDRGGWKARPSQARSQRGMDVHGRERRLVVQLNGTAFTYTRRPRTPRTAGTTRSYSR